MQWNSVRPPRLSRKLGRAAFAVTLLGASLGSAAPATFAQDLPDLTLNIARSKTDIGLGETVDFTFTMSDPGAVGASGVLMTGDITGADSLSIIQQPTGQSQDCTLSVPLTLPTPLGRGTPVSLQANHLTCSDILLAANGAPAIVKVRATASSTTPGTISASGFIDPVRIATGKDQVDESNESNNDASSDVTVKRLPDLDVDFLDGPNIVEGGAPVTFKVRVLNHGGKTDDIDLDFRSDRDDLNYESVDFVDDVRHGFSCDIKEPVTARNFVTCSHGELGDPNANPANDESVTLLIGAKVKTRLPFSDKDRSVTVTVDQNHSIRESNEDNNTAKHAFHYD